MCINDVAEYYSVYLTMGASGGTELPWEYMVYLARKNPWQAYTVKWEVKKWERYQ